MPSSWLLLHGEGVFLGLVVAAMGLGALGWGPWRRAHGRRVVRRHERLRAPPTPPGRFSDGVGVVLQGRLELTGAPCARFEDGEPVAVASIELHRLQRESARGERLAVNVQGTAVELSGDVDLVVGSLEMWSHSLLGRLPRAIAERAALAGLEIGSVAHRRAILRSLVAGDTVHAAGRLEVAAADREPGEYRRAARRFRLVADEPGLQIAIGARGRTRFAGRWLATLRAGVLGAVAAGLGSLLVGELGLWADDPTWLVASACTPVRHYAAMERLADRVRGMDALTPAARREALTLSRVPRYCETVAQSLLWAGDPRTAARVGERCRTDFGFGIAARARTQLGDLERASSAAARAPWSLDPRTQVRMHLLAGKVRRAAEAAARHRGHLPECLPDAIAARAGDRAALGRLATAARRIEESARVCGLLYADLLSGWDRLQFLDGRVPMGPRGGRRHPSLPDRLATLLWLEVHPSHPPSIDSMTMPGPLERDDRVLPETNPERLGLELETELYGVPALEHSVLLHILDSGPLDERSLALRGRLASSRAVFESVTGRDDEARAWSERAVRDYEALARLHRGARHEVAGAAEEAHGLQAAIEVRAGDPRRARRALEKVPATAWFAPLLRRVAVWAGPPPAGMCGEENAPTNHCGAIQSSSRRDAMWWSIEASTDSPANRQLVTTADLARLAHRSPAEGAGELERWLVRRREALREALSDRDRAVLLAVLDDPESGQVSTLSGWLTERARSLAGGATVLSDVGWLEHRDTRSQRVTLTAGRCTVFVLEGSGAAQATMRLVEPEAQRIWESDPRESRRDLHVCPSASGQYRLDVRAGPWSGLVAVSWFDRLAGKVPHGANR